MISNKVLKESLSMIWQIQDYKIIEEFKFEDIVAVKIFNSKNTYRKNYTTKGDCVYNENGEKVLDYTGKVFGKLSDFLD